MKALLSCIAVAALLVSVSGCEKHKPGTVKYADFKKAWSSEVDDMSKMKEPMDQKVAAFVSKVGTPPAADTGRKKTWFAMDGDKCTKIDLDTKDGSLSESSTAKTDCGS